MKKILAVTACPTGVAHTYMAAESLEKKAKEMGVDIKVETQGSIGTENALTDQEIKEAAGIIIAADTTIQLDRFAGKPVIQTGTQAAIKSPGQLIQQILDGKAPVLEGQVQSQSQSTSNGKGVYKHIMNGVSHMIPFVVTGGLLIAISLAVGGQPTEAGLVIPEDSIWHIINMIGGAAMGLMVPILSAYIAFSIGDRPALVPGFVGGLISVNGEFYGSEANAGFLGGIIAGLLAGYIVYLLKKIKVPKAMQSVMPIIFIPIISTLIVGFAFSFLIGKPVALVFESLTNWLAGMKGANRAILAAILGALIASDMGGPLNKTAFMFGSVMIGSGNFSIMGAVSVAICIPPIGMGLATLMFPHKFDQQSKDSGKASLAMGFFGITEGAIPFATRDPLRAIPSNIVGGVVGAIIGMLAGVGDHVAHGGPIVAILGAVDNVFMFFVAAAIGSIITAVMFGLLKKPELASPASANGAPVAGAGKGPSLAGNSSQAEKNEGVELNKLTDIMSHDLIELNMETKNKEDTIQHMTDVLGRSGKIINRQMLIDQFKAREEEGTTGVGLGVAIPHAKSDGISDPRVVFGRSSQGIEWDSLDGEPVNLVFMIAIPEKYQNDMHLKILQMLSRRLMDDQFRKDLLKADSKEKVYELLETVTAEEETTNSTERSKA